MTKLIADEALREQIEEFALHMKPGTTKGKHRTAIFDTLELAKLVQHLIAQAQRQLLAELLEQADNFVLVDASSTDVTIIGSDRAVPVSIINHYLTKAEPGQGEKG